MSPPRSSPQGLAPMTEQGGVCRKEVEKPLEIKREPEKDLLTDAGFTRGSLKSRLRNKDMNVLRKKKLRQL